MITPITVEGIEDPYFKVNLKKSDLERQWMNVDRELFQLLGAQAGTALIAANLYAASAGPIQALAGVRQKLAAAEAASSESTD